jgi:phosphotransferase system HPr (HPr) family protein
VIKNKYGLHARPARLIVEAAMKFECDVHISKNGEEINAKSIMGILMLEARKGTELSVICHGEDEQEALDELKKVFQTISELKEWEEV